MQKRKFLSITERGILVQRTDGSLRIDFAEPGIVRVRKFLGDKPPTLPLIRYGFFRNEWPQVNFHVEGGDASVTASTELLAVTINRSDGKLAIQDAAHSELLSEWEPALSGPQPGFRVRFNLPPTRAFFGLGDQTRERIEHRETRGDLWVRNVTSYIPIPLLLTNDGFGLLVNTTRRLWFDLGASSCEWFGFEAEGATLDYYFLYGPSLKEVLSRYTEVTGKPPLPPKWSLGLWFLCRTQADAREFMDDCYNFRREGIPCDAIGLEPGWMAKNYDFSVDKDWHPERFPVPSYARVGRHNFLSAARRMGFKPGLWLCCDYDLSYEEERWAHKSVGPEESSAFATGHGHAIVKRLDPWTRPEESWFKHLEQFVDQGVEWFKQDGSNQVFDHPDRLWGNGMLDDEMHNLYPLLYSKPDVRRLSRARRTAALCFHCGGLGGPTALRRHLDGRYGRRRRAVGRLPEFEPLGPRNDDL